MKARLLRYAARLDAATLRERVLVFLAAAAVLGAAVHFAMWQPLRAKQQRALVQLQANQAELKKLQASFEAGVRAASTDPDAAMLAREKALRAALADLNTKIAKEQRRFTPPESMRSVLEELLEKNKRLALVDLKTVPVAPLTVRGAAGTPGLYRHGIELAVSGTYSDLYDYLKALESLPAQLYWGRAELEVTQHPAITLKLTLFTVSFDKAWLIV
jgi:MSHA biogenesis protein MshJ